MSLKHMSVSAATVLEATELTGIGVLRMKKRYLFIMLGVLIMLSFSGCGTQKYKVNFDGYGFESRKTEYAEGKK